MKRRLKRVAMDMNSFQSSINQVSQKGRQILKSLEDFKFTLEQTARLLNNNQQLAQGMISKRKGVDELSSKLYQIVFDIENTDISQAFEQQNAPVMQAPPNNKGEGQPKPPGMPGMPGQPPVPGAPGVPGQPPAPGGMPAPGGPAGPGGVPGGGPIPGGGAPVPGSAPGGPSKGNDKEDSGKDDEKEEPKENNDKEEE